MKNLVKELFEGKMESYIQCKNVDYKSSKEEIFTDLQLVVKKNANIYEGLDELFQQDELSGDNAYMTENYGKQDALKGQRFKNLPPILVFQLNRFAYDYKFDENVKINDHFEFYETINLKKYLEDKSEDAVYDLIAVYTHLGSRGNSGHYKVFIKSENRWIEFDDEDVEEVDFNFVKKSSFGGRFYESVLDLKNFGLKYKKKEAYGHAYRIVYIQ